MHYRKKVTIIKEQKATPGGQNSSVSPSEEAYVQSAAQPAAQSAANDGWQKKYLPLALVLGGVVVGSFFLIRSLASSLGAGRFGTIVFLIVCVSGAIYLYHLYAEQMTATFHSLRENALNVKKNVETRDEKTNNSLGDLREPSGASSVPATSQGK